ncbi:hypothetical protein KKH27_13495 [bacterium]|nr:hypothetical protein [bacterium]MBU1984604.1 hypothetical protein [bacterium]
MYVPQIAILWAHFRRPALALAITGLVVVLGLLLRLEGRLVAAIATLVGLLTSAFTGLAGLVILVPWIGPLVIKALSIPFLWLMNGAGYFTAIFLMHKGHSRSVVDSRVLTYVLLIGIMAGYIIGKLI